MFNTIRLYTSLFKNNEPINLLVSVPLNFKNDEVDKTLEIVKKAKRNGITAKGNAIVTDLLIHDKLGSIEYPITLRTTLPIRNIEPFNHRVSMDKDSFQIIFENGIDEYRSSHIKFKFLQEQIECYLNE